MPIAVEWPDFGPDVTLTVDVTSNVLTLVATSQLVNYADFDLTAPDIHAYVMKNGVKQGTITINSSNGNLSMSSLSVASGDHIVFVFKHANRLSLPWMCRLTATREIFMDVPASNGTTVFSTSSNRMPVPAFDLAFGWDANNHLKVGVKVGSGDSATQDYALYTRLFGTCPNQESSSTISTSSSSVQTHTSLFVRSDMAFDCELELYLKSGGGATRQEERVRLAFQSADDIPSYPASFPTSGTALHQTKVTGGLKLDQ